ncbi:MAG TPA: class I SAM-dependent methyltransferase, partial [Solirubrobacterales bacterium]|nr:class I SAM-dependent methyltransferase [Solirubrobacterales bacterium]
MSATAIWHDVECGSYAADLPLWEELAERCGGPVLELGCGTGRVALHLARRGHRVIGLDRDRELILEFSERAANLPVQPLCANALDLELDEP